MKEEKQRAIQRFSEGLTFKGNIFSVLKFEDYTFLIWMGEVIAWTEDAGNTLHLKWGEREAEIVREIFNDIFKAFGSRQSLSVTSTGRWVLGFGEVHKRVWRGSFTWQRPIDWDERRTKK